MTTVKRETSDGVLACRICLATNTKLFGLHEHGLNEAFVNIMGTSLSAWDGLPQFLCTWCRTQLLASAGLRQRCRRAEELLREALLQQHSITLNYLETIDRLEHQLALCLSVTHNTTTIDTNHEETQMTLEAGKQELDDFDYYHPEFDEPIINIKNNMLLESLHSYEVEIKEELPVNVREKEKRVNKIKEERDKRVKRVKEDKAKRVKKIKQVKEKIVKVKEEKGRKKKKLRKYFATEEDYSKFEKTYNIEITKLSEEEQLQEIQDRKESTNYLRASYKCELCFKGFLSETTYDNHQKKTHDLINGNNVCKLCGARFRYAAGLRKHFESHMLKFTCKICQFVTRHRSMATMHSDFHSGKTFVCKYCGLTFNKQTTFNTHTRVQHPLENSSAGTCNVCGETFTGRRGLMQHRAIAHKKLTVPEFKCRVCLVQFDSLEAKTAHKVDNICNPKLRACPTCGERFPDDDGVKGHIKESHGKEHYQCDQCDSQFAKKSSLSVHIERVHLKIKPKKPAFYKYHQYDGQRLKLRHSEICEICGKGYPDTTWLRYHQRTHTGERPYKCTQCTKSYMTPAALQRHQVIHTGERRWQCSQCPKTFLHQSSIYTHKLVHTGERPYACQICSKTFTQSGSLQTHVKYVHMKLKPPPRKRREYQYKPAAAL